MKDLHTILFKKIITGNNVPMRKKKIIQTVLPKNIKSDDESLFKRREYYKIPELKVRMFQNIFLTHYGIALKNLLPIRRTLPNAWYFRNPNAGFIFHFYRKAIEVFLVCKYGKSLKTKTLDADTQYLFAFSPWFGYFSWVTESLPRILKTIDKHAQLTLILPESYAKKKFVSESLKLFPELKQEIIPEGVHMHVPQITIPELKPLTYVFNPDEMISYRDFIWSKVENMKINIKTFEKIYVSRSKAKNRKIINNEEVENIFRKFGFQILNFEDYSFFEQVYLMKHCKILGGVHGAGLTWSIFMNPNSLLIELYPGNSNTDNYIRFCNIAKINYKRLSVSITKGNVNEFRNATVNLNKQHINKIKQMI